MVVQYVLGSILMVMALALVLLVLVQSGKDTRLSGSISGGSESYYGQNKGRSRDKLLARITLVVALLFVGTLIAAYVLIARYYSA
jgi:preprotein translocase subunit SecG